MYNFWLALILKGNFNKMPSDILLKKQKNKNPPWIQKNIQSESLG